jgi:type IV pilus assembly protein PilB
MGLLDVLATKNVIEQDDIASIKQEVLDKGIQVEDVLHNRGVSPKAIISAKAEYLNIPTRTIGETSVPHAVLEYVPQESAEHYRFVPLAVEDNVLQVGILDPDNLEARDALNFISSKIGLPFKLFLITEEDFAKVIEMYQGLTSEVGEALTELESELKVPAKEGQVEGINPAENKKQQQEDTKIIEDAPVTKIVATILRYAIEGNTSDVHIERMRENVRVRFRVDGTLNTSLVLPKEVHSAVVARIKILSNMRLDEKRKPQDGRFSAKIEGRKIDFRVSTFPTYYGEKIVMRILDQEKGVLKLEDLGLSEHNLKAIKNAMNRPYGLILISGPTGSGKTTTLYSMLNEIDKEGQNVLSLEDPVEYNIEGVSQSQVRADIGYTFANGLRTILRQDPDIIMVGEIRDKETAKLAIQAALTGHLVLSTIHTNNAIGAIPRLVDMGVDPYLIAPTLILAMAQRLVRKMCPGAGDPVKEEGMKAMLEKQFADLPEEFKKNIKFGEEFYNASPTPECPTGTRGRIAVMEVLEVDTDMQRTILHDPTEPAIWKLARSKGMLTMKEDAMLKSFEKQVPFEEVNSL